MPGRPTTTQRGYGHSHQVARREALEDLRQRDGQRCPRCGEPMWWADAANLDLDHTDDRTTYQGLAHSACNRRAGQAKAMRLKAAREQLGRRSRNW